jgi:GAF domain-containing protein
VGIGSIAAGQLVPASGRIPVEVASVLGIATIVLAYGFLLLFLWDVSRRFKTTAQDLRSVISMSSDLSRTMDPLQVGDRIARHIAEVVDASEAGICHWDRATDRLITMGCHPAERAADLLPWYRLADYPATRTVLETSVPLIVDVADPNADPNELAYLASIGMRSMAMVPMIAAGTAIGTLEFMSTRSGVFGPHDLEIATMLAGEGAMALENARLYEEIRHQDARWTDRTRQPPAVSRSGGPRDRAGSRTGRPAVRHPVHRPRRLQGPQRHPRARSRRRRPRCDGRAGVRFAPTKRYRRQARW